MLCYVFIQGQPRPKNTCVQLFVLNPNSGGFLLQPVLVNILHQVEAHPIQMSLWCFYLAAMTKFKTGLFLWHISQEFLMTIMLQAVCGCANSKSLFQFIYLIIGRQRTLGRCTTFKSIFYLFIFIIQTRVFYWKIYHS